MALLQEDTNELGIKRWELGIGNWELGYVTKKDRYYAVFTEY
jgi:hypothetical protein